MGALNARPPLDRLTSDIADYVDGYVVDSAHAYDAAHLCLLDTLGCALEALTDPDCTKLLGPLVPGTVVPHGARVPGTSFVLDPLKAAFDISCLGRWTDFSDTYFGAQGCHPSDNIGGLLAVADHLSRQSVAARREPLPVRDLLAAVIKAYEIQGVLAMQNSFYDVGLDHAALVKVATAAVATKMLDGSRDQIANAVSNAWIDGHSLCIYRRSPHAGTRKSWAGADATSRGVFLGLLSVCGEMGYPSALTAKTWGLHDVLLRGRPLTVPQAFGCTIVQDIQFKVAFPTVFNSQTAAECAVRLHPLVGQRITDIREIRIWAHRTTLKLNTARGPLATPAERDHCVQYIVATGLLKGHIESSDYDEVAASDPRIDALREKTVVVEDERYTRDYADPAKRASANAVQVTFRDGTTTPRIAVEYPLGHPTRRAEALPALNAKFDVNLARIFPEQQRARIRAACASRSAAESMPVNELMSLFAAPSATQRV
jgi:2-methylcitrate dehydratase